MVPRRVLLRIKKLRRFLDERIRHAVTSADTAEDAEERAEAVGRLEAYQDVRDEMIGERLDDEEVDVGGEEEGEDAGAPEAAEEAGETASAG